MRRMKLSCALCLFAFSMFLPIMAQDKETGKKNSDNKGFYFDALDRYNKQEKLAPTGLNIGDLPEEERLRAFKNAERAGLVRPRKDGILTEFEQGFSYSALRIFGNEDKMRMNQHLKPYSTYELASLDPVDIARTIGTGLGYVLAIGIPVLILASPFLIAGWIKKRKRQKDAESIRSIQNELKQVQEKKEEQEKNDQALLSAMDELETGNLDKLTWAKALIAADGDEKRAKIEYLKLRGQ